MKNIYFYWFLGIIGVVVAGAAAMSFVPIAPASDSQVKETGSYALVASEPFFDFGTISMSAGKVTHTFNIKNTGKPPTVIDKVNSSCMCTIATLVTQSGSEGPFGMPGHGTIPRIARSSAPGEEARVDIVFDPAAHGPEGTGKVRRTVYLETGGGPDSASQLTFEATVTP